MNLPPGEYYCRNSLNLYDAPACEVLATQAKTGRHLQVLSSSSNPINAIKVRLCEDNYLAWLPLNQVNLLVKVDRVYQAIAFSRSEIEQLLPEVINFTLTAMKQPNYYLWGGTIGPNYDCSGLIQAAFANSGIWLPRDSYEQAEFTLTITKEQLVPGDLIFFGKPKINHVALYLGNNQYIHSSGKEKGRNGIAIEQLSLDGDEVSQSYYRQLAQFGRVMSSLYSIPKSIVIRQGARIPLSLRH